MIPAFDLACRAMHLGLLRSASLLTPTPRRAEWWREWQSELWHVRRMCTPSGGASWQAQRDLTAFCLGAFQDALCLRRQAWHTGAHFPSLRIALFHGSAPQCIAALALVLASSWILSILLPGVRVESHPERYKVNPGLILIEAASVSDDSAPTITAANFEAWKARRQRFFDGFAFYRLAQETVDTATHLKARITVAHASANLLAFLGLPVQYGPSTAEAAQDMPALILSEEIWRREFGANPHVVGEVFCVGSRMGRVAGVAPEGIWRLPGKPDAWLLEPDSALAGVGFVVAHLTPRGRSEMLGERVHITTNNPDDSDDDLWGESFEERTRGPQGIYLFTLLLAFLALPAITSVSIGDYSFNAHRLPWAKKLGRWAYLTGKIVLLLPIVYLVSLDLAYGNPAFNSMASQYIQLISSFALCLFGMRWILLDQRQRCPVCLRRVTHPAQVGQASRTFLAWNGTELMCASGHTLLHVPGLPTSWFSTQRWLYLDTSWDFLFAGTGIG